MVTTGTIFSVLNPVPIKYELSDIPVVETEVVVIIMQSTDSFKYVPIISNIDKSETGKLLFNNAQLINVHGLI